MRERTRGDGAASEYHALPRETREILADAMEAAGRYIELVPDPSISEYARATIKVSRSGGGSLALAYDPHYEHQLGYLVAHECAHVLRLYGVPAESRLVPVTTRLHKARMVSQCSAMLRHLSRQGLPDQALAQLTDMWLEGVVRQLWNTPTDMRIERWLTTNYPGLGEMQAEALRGQVEDNYQVLALDVRESTPAKVYEVANSMNAAYARYIGRLLGSRDLFTPYRRSGYGDIGRSLADEIWDAEDRGYYSDVDDAQRWAERFALDEWFEWRPLSNAQETVRLA